MHVHVVLADADICLFTLITSCAACKIGASSISSIKKKNKYRFFN